MGEPPCSDILLLCSRLGSSHHEPYSCGESLSPAPVFPALKSGAIKSGFLLVLCWYSKLKGASNFWEIVRFSGN